MYYPEELVEEVRQKNDIVDVISGYVSMKKKGANYVGLCPFHNEKTGSFMVNQNKQIYKCFGCGAGGNVFTFIMEYENFTFVEALKYLAEKANVTLPEAEYNEEAKQKQSKRSTLLAINKEAAKYFYYQLRQQQGKNGIEYFVKRELSDDTMKKFGLGFANMNSNDLILYLKQCGYQESLIKDAGVASFHEKYGFQDKFWNRVMFPIQDINHRVVGFGGRVLGDGEPKYLNSPETDIFDKSRNLYGLNFARTSRKKYMILCEGYMDVIAMHQAGFTEAVASLGTAFTSGQASLLRRYAENVILAYDSDNAGTKAAIRAVGILRETGLTGKILHLEPYKDPDEFIKNLGAEEFQKRIEDAEDSFSFELRMLERDYDMKTAEGKTKFRSAVVEKLYEVADQFDDAIPFIEAACEKYNFSYDAMSKSVTALANKKEMNAGIVRKNTIESKQNILGKKIENPNIKNEKILLSWMVEEPRLYEKILPYISPEDFSEGILKIAANKVYEIFQSGETPSPSAIMTFLQMDETIGEDEQAQIASLFCTRISDDLRLISGIHEDDLLGEQQEFDSKAEKEKALIEIMISIKKASLQRFLEKGTADKNTFNYILKTKKTLQNMQRMHISID